MQSGPPTINNTDELSAYDFDLPEELIARYPQEKRDQSRLLHYNLESKSLKHLAFSDITHLLKAGDLLVLNKTQVLASRFYLQPLDIEILLLTRKGDQWEAIAKPLKKLKDGASYQLKNGQTVKITKLKQDASSEISPQILVNFGSEEDFNRAVREAAEMPIPPYLKRRAEEIDKERYQTIFAQDSASGFSIAAPTAGLHFSDEILTKLRTKGVEILELTLHVGLGTFLPIKSQTISGHKMHSEYYEISSETWQKILSAKSAGQRIISVGSTASRALESAAATGTLTGETDIYIYPPYKFKIIDGMLTNFHLPRSTLLLMVSALAGQEEILNIYKEAVIQRYRFFSYGDCMLLL